MNSKLLILCGIPFSGKTTLAKALVSIKGYTRIDLDEVKFKMLGSQVTNDKINQSGWDRIYQDMYRQIKQALMDGKTVVHDTGNFTKYERDLVKKIADDLGITSVTIYVDIPVREAKKRLLSNRTSNIRFDVSDADFESAVKEMEPPSLPENYIVFNWSDNIDSFVNTSC